MVYENKGIYIYIYTKKKVVFNTIYVDVKQRNHHIEKSYTR